MKKHPFKIMLTVGWIGAASLWAQDTPTVASGGEPPAIPTEVFEPPYSIGDLVPEQGYYIDRGEGEVGINIRFFENKFRLCWIDEAVDPTTNPNS